MTVRANASCQSRPPSPKVTPSPAQLHRQCSRTTQSGESTGGAHNTAERSGEGRGGAYPARQRRPRRPRGRRPRQCGAAAAWRTSSALWRRPPPRPRPCRRWPPRCLSGAAPARRRQQSSATAVSARRGSLRVGKMALGHRAACQLQPLRARKDGTLRAPIQNHQRLRRAQPRRSMLQGMGAASDAPSTRYDVGHPSAPHPRNDTSRQDAPTPCHEQAAVPRRTGSSGVATQRNARAESWRGSVEPARSARAGAPRRSRGL